MADYIKGTEGLHECDFDARFSRTFVGQAHIAGTGPDGETCRNCRFWFVLDKKGNAVGPGYYAASAATPNALKDAKCHAPMPGKANKAFPHYAGACRLFEPTDRPFPLQQER